MSADGEAEALRWATRLREVLAAGERPLGGVACATCWRLLPLSSGNKRVSLSECTCPHGEVQPSNEAIKRLHGIDMLPEAVFAFRVPRTGLVVTE